VAETLLPLLLDDGDDGDDGSESESSSKSKKVEAAANVNRMTDHQGLSAMHKFSYYITGPYGGECMRLLLEKGGGDAFLISDRGVPCPLKMAINQGNHHVVKVVFDHYQDEHLSKYEKYSGFRFEEMLETCVYTSSFLCQAKLSNAPCERCQQLAVGDDVGESITAAERAITGYPHNLNDTNWPKIAHHICDAMNLLSLGGGGKKRFQKRLASLYEEFGVKQYNNAPRSEVLRVFRDRLLAMQGTRALTSSPSPSGPSEETKGGGDKKGGKKRSTRCANCGKSKQDYPSLKFKKCSRCFVTIYCSIDCQKKHWKSEHKRLCHPAVD
jgi:hypothetical protein